MAFKNGPLHGVLFFIPPLTFYYISKRGKIMKEAVGRCLGPALPILGVVLLFVLVPWFRGDTTFVDTAVSDRLRNNLDVLKEKIKTDVMPPQDSEK